MANSGALSLMSRTLMDTLVREIWLWFPKKERGAAWNKKKRRKKRSCFKSQVHSVTQICIFQKDSYLFIIHLFHYFVSFFHFFLFSLYFYILIYLFSIWRTCGQTDRQAATVLVLAAITHASKTWLQGNTYFALSICFCTRTMYNTWRLKKWIIMKQWQLKWQ